MRVELPCPWADDDELGVEDVTRDAQASVSGEAADEVLRELTRRVTGGESLATVDTNPGSRGGRRNETRVSELVSIVEIFDEVIDGDEDEDKKENENKDETTGQDGVTRDGSLLFIERGGANDAMPSVHDAVLLVALYSEYMPKSDAPALLLAAVRASTSQSTEELVASVLPATLTGLHDVIVAHVEFEQSQVCSVTLESYNGPTAWERCMGCMKLTWLVKHMHPDTLGDEDGLMVLLHALALGSKDVSYQVRNQSMECLDALIGVLETRARGKTGAYARAASDILKDIVAANDDRCWSSAYRCMGHLIRALAEDPGAMARRVRENGGEDVFHVGEHSKVVAELFEQGMGLAQRNRHSLDYASVWLDTLGAELHALGIELMHHRPVLLPMLVDWAKALHAEVRLGALRCLLVYVQQCWPRNRAVWAMIQSDLRQLRETTSGDEACRAVLDRIDEVFFATGPRCPLA